MLTTKSYVNKMDAKGNIERILVVDDERDNVLALLDFFDRCVVDYDFCDTLSEAVEYVLDAQQEGCPYSAVVCDNHFKEEVECCPNFNGIDFVRVLMGAKLDKEQTDFVGINFDDPNIYEQIVDHYRGKIIMFSGSAHLECDLSGLLLAQKFPDQQGVCCERGVVSLLERLGFDFDESGLLVEEIKFEKGLVDGSSEPDAVFDLYLDDDLPPDAFLRYYS